MSAVPIIDPVYPPGTPANIIQAYMNNVNCICAAGDPSCSNCLTVSPEYLLESRDAPAIAGIIAVPIIAFIVVVMRTYSRAFIIRKLGMDDWLTLVTFFLYIPFVVLSLILIDMGSGRHLPYIQFVLIQDPSFVQATETYDFVAHILYTTALFVCRLSGIAFYIRLLTPGCRPYMITTSKVAAGLLFVGYIPQIILLIVHCLPITSLWPYGWEANANDYTCLAWGTVYAANSGISLLCDMMMVSIPALLIASLKISTKEKLLLVPVLFLGVPVIVISSIRLYLVVEGQWLPDQSWWYDPMLVIENAEIGCTLIALCAPGLKPLCVHGWQRMGTYMLTSHPSGTPRRVGSHVCTSCAHCDHCPECAIPAGATMDHKPDTSSSVAVGIATEKTEGITKTTSITVV